MARTLVYAELSDIQAKIPFFTLGASSKPNTGQVTDFIAGISDELDVRLGRAGYAVPIPTGATRTWDVLNQWTSVGAAMETVAAMPQGGDGKHLAHLERRWNAILKALDNGDATLPDEGLTVASTSGGRARAGGSEPSAAKFTRCEEL